ncbi:MAG TPA: hypothetical protein VNG04_05365, partial [Candidatus Acidoferrum sp.]|nr:hypothetical protein [Candidatus Acidoferrum sp.]
MAKRIEKLTREQQARMDEWADRWIEIGLATGRADWDRFEASARECYRFAGIPWPGVVVRVPSPIVGALAAPIADLLIEKIRNRTGTRKKNRDAVDGAVRGAVRGAVGD